MSYHRRGDCRICGQTELPGFLELGPTPLANAFLSEPEPAEEPSYPLDLFFCPTCSLVQLLDVVSPEVLFRDYVYVTGISHTIATHNAEYARSVVEHEGLGAGDLVVEVASNDGSLLRAFQPHGVRTLGVEPATNIAEMAREAGVDTVNEFFASSLVARIREEHGAARVIIGNNVLAHVDQPVDFLAGCRAALDEGGLCAIEVPYLGDLLTGCEFDTVYHEHLSYFSITSLMHLYERAGLYIERIRPVAVHGGSIRILARPAKDEAEHGQEVRALARREVERGMTGLERYREFAVQVHRLRDDLLAMLEGWREAGRSVAGYGAPAKGNTLLNFCGLDTRLIPYTVDRNPLKIGKYTPGAHIPVLAVSNLLSRKPDHTLILAWNFADEIVRQERAYVEGGGRFAVPIPSPRLLTETTG